MTGPVRDVEWAKRMVSYERTGSADGWEAVSDEDANELLDDVAADTAERDQALAGGAPLTIDDPRWDAFVDALVLALEVEDDPRTFNSICEGGTDKSHAEAVLRGMGLDDADVAASLAYFEQHGGMRDCQILLNVDIEEPGP